MNAPAAQGFAARNLRDLLRHGLATVALCCVIAVALTVSGQGDWSAQLVYSLAIGLVSWLVIDLGRLLLSGGEPAPWPRGMRGIVLVAAGIGMGFLVGSAIGDAFSGRGAAGTGAMDARRLVSTLVITLAATVAICYFFYSRGKRDFLQGEIARAQRDAADARLKLLQTQLEPHMLFNTLANLRVLIATDPARAVDMLDRLNSYLRVTLSGSRATAHPLAAEFDRLGDYLALMAVRMGPRLRFRLELPEALRALPVPPLLLQPLVENAIRHGLEPRVEGGEIVVRAECADGRLHLEVRDSGIGIGQASEPSREPAAGTGFGLGQVRERLASLHGDAAALDIAEAPGGGTRVRIVLPVSP